MGRTARRLIGPAGVAGVVLGGMSGAVAAGPSWDWQLSAPFQLSRALEIIGLDPDNHTRRDIAALAARGIMTVCYVSVGTVEEYRADAGVFPESVIGKVYDDWPDERFLDIRRRDLLLPIMRTRFEKCRAMGFAAVEPDNQDVHSNDSGFPVRRADTLAYLSELATMAHGMGLRIGQKNVPDLTEALVGRMDFVITEGCHDDGWCAEVLAYARAGKPVLAAEYTDTRVDFAAACAWGAIHGASFILKDRDLTRSLKTCP